MGRGRRSRENDERLYMNQRLNANGIMESACCYRFAENSDLSMRDYTPPNTSSRGSKLVLPPMAWSSDAKLCVKVVIRHDDWTLHANAIETSPLRTLEMVGLCPAYEVRIACCCGMPYMSGISLPTQHELDCRTHIACLTDRIDVCYHGTCDMYTILYRPKEAGVAQRQGVEIFEHAMRP